MRQKKYQENNKWSSIPCFSNCMLFHNQYKLRIKRKNGWCDNRDCRYCHDLIFLYGIVQFDWGINKFIKEEKIALLIYLYWV